jgi:hypothetical protein
MNLKRNFALALVLAILGSAFAQSASAHGYYGHGGRVVVGVGIGAPYWGWGWGYGYPYPGYYYPPAYTYPAYPAQPSTYIQQDAAPAPAPQQNYWYYCSDAQAYYPYVKECPGGWQRVAPQPQR